MTVFTQAGYEVRLEWATEGAATLGGECAVLVVVDVLSFSTTVDVVVGAGGAVRPRLWRGGSSVRTSAALSLTPGSTLDLPSPNGAMLCRAAASTGALVLAGCLRNADAVAAAAHELAGEGSIGVLPAGERWGVDVSSGAETGPLRPALEDHLGAGAIADALIRLGRLPSPEASLAATAFRNTDLASALAECSSGQELIEAGHRRDVELAAELNISTTTPRLADGTIARG